MKQKIVLLFLMSMILTITCISTAIALDGNSTSSVLFHVHSSSDYASIRLKSVKGVAYVEKHSIWGANPVTGYEEEDTHGFYNITIAGPGKNETIHWVPSVATAIDLFGSNFESSDTLQISFPYSGDYTVAIEPMDNSYASSNYWLVDRLLYWTIPATWSITKENQCYADYSSCPQPPFNGTVYIYCYDEFGNELSNFSQLISSSTYIAPPSFKGYTTSSKKTYVQLNSSTGACSPSVIYFNYTHSNTSFTIPQFPTTGYTVWLRNQNVERIQPQCGPGYNYSVFASMSGNTKLYKPREIDYMSAHFYLGDWVYVEFGYNGKLKYGFFEKSLFTLSGDWNSIPFYSLNIEKQGKITTATTPYNGPGTNCGSYSSCELYPGDTVNACMVYNNWYLCRFYNNHSNHYGDVYLWVPGSAISWN